MTKLQHYDELEIDERPRVCGGTVFLKLLKKGRCASSSQKNGSPMLTSSSSFSSSQASSMIEYDPTKAQYCMPRQLEGAGTGEADDGSFKLDFKLQAEEQSDFYYHNEANVCFGDEPHGIIKLNPQAVNHLKTMHMQSVNGETAGKGSTVEPRRDFLAANADEDIDTAWNELQSKKQAPTESKATILRKEMSSFRKELNAVRRSLPNQFDTNYFSEESDSMKENLRKESQDDFDCDQKKYFKNDWNLNFQDQENNIETDTTHDLNTSQTNESFPECPEMPFDQGLNTEEIVLNHSVTPQETESNVHTNTHDEEREPDGSYEQSKHELDQIKCLRVEDSRASSTADSNYEEDMDLVRKLLRKYGDKIDDDDEKRRFDDKARRLQAVVDPPTDAWFHRHASGVCKKPEKLSISEAYEVPKQSPSCMREPSVPEKPKESHRAAEHSPPKKTVHFKEPAAYDATEEKPLAETLKSTPGLKTSFEDDRQPINANTVRQPIDTNTVRQPIDSNTVNPMFATRRSPGRLSAKIKYWEEKKI